MGEVTILLRRWSKGDESALQELIPLVYDELKRLAAFCLSGCFNKPQPVV